MKKTARRRWDHDGKSRHERGYGAAWVKLRATILDRDGHLCQSCQRKGRPTPATQVDHIVPKAQGGTDDPGNLQSICQRCHDEKSKVETGYRQRQVIGLDGWPDKEASRHFGYSIPDGVKPSGIPVTLVCGPPASGKSTYIRQHAEPIDTIVDFDVYLKQIGAEKWTTDKAAVRKAFAMRDAHIRGLEAKTQGRAWIIATAPTRAERNAWTSALGNVTPIILDVDAETCIRRLSQDEDRAHAIDRVERSIREWWRQYQR